MRGDDLVMLKRRFTILRPARYRPGAVVEETVTGYTRGHYGCYRNNETGTWPLVFLPSRLPVGPFRRLLRDARAACLALDAAGLLPATVVDRETAARWVRENPEKFREFFRLAAYHNTGGDV